MKCRQGSTRNLRSTKTDIFICRYIRSSQPGLRSASQSLAFFIRENILHPPCVELIPLILPSERNRVEWHSMLLPAMSQNWTNSFFSTSIHPYEKRKMSSPMRAHSDGLLLPSVFHFKEREKNIVPRVPPPPNSLLVVSVSNEVFEKRKESEWVDMLGPNLDIQPLYLHAIWRIEIRRRTETLVSREFSCARL